MIEYKLEKINNEITAEIYADGKLIKKATYLFEDLKDKTNEEIIKLIESKKFTQVKSEEVFY